MRILALLAAILGMIPQRAHAAQAYILGPTISTTTGKVTQHMAGVLNIAASSATISTPTITLDGAAGSVRASSATLTYGIKAATLAFTAGGGINTQVTVIGSSLTVQDKFLVGASTLSVVNARVGIGTTNPSRTLSLDGGGSAAVISSFSAAGQTLQLSADSGGSYLYEGDSTLAAGGPLIGFDNVGAAAANKGIYLGFAGNAQFLIDGTGAVTTMPRISSTTLLLDGSGNSVTAASMTLTGAGSAAYNLTTSSGIHMTAGEIKMELGSAGIVWPDGTRSTSALSPGNVGAAVSTVSYVGNQTITATSAPGETISQSTRTLIVSANNVGVEYCFAFNTDGNSGTKNIYRLYVDGVTYGDATWGDFAQRFETNGQLQGMAHCLLVEALSAGSHSLWLMAWESGGSGAFVIHKNSPPMRVWAKELRP